MVRVLEFPGALHNPNRTNSVSTVCIRTSPLPRLRPLAHRERFAFQRPVGYSEIPVATVAASDGRTN